MKTRILLSLLANSAFLHAQATFELDKEAYLPGESITATWSGGPGNAKDWIGIYPWPHPDGGVPDSTPPSTRWLYVSGSQTAGAAGLAEGSVTFTMPPNLAAGEWAAYFLADDGYAQITEPIQFSVIDITIDSFKPERSFIDGSPIRLNWAISDRGLPVETLTVDGGTGLIDVLGETSFEVNPTETTVYYLDVNGGQPSARTIIWKEQGSTENFSIDQTDYFPGESIQTTWSGAIGGETDWIGVYRVGDLPGPATDPRAQRSILWRTSPGEEGNYIFGEPDLPPGDYFVCRFLNDAYDVEFGPIRFSVVPFRINDFQLSDDEVTLTWTSRASDPGYDIQGSSDLVQWNEVEGGVNVPPAPGDARETTLTFSRPTGDNPPRFFRVVRFE